MREHPRCSMSQRAARLRAAGYALLRQWDTNHGTGEQAPDSNPLAVAAVSYAAPTNAAHDNMAASSLHSLLVATLCR